MDAHLGECENCRTAFETEQRFLSIVRESRGVRVASPELRERIEKLLASALPVPVAPPKLRQRIRRSLWQVNSRAPRTSYAQPALAVAVMLAVALLIGVWGVWRLSKNNGIHVSGPSDFSMMAAETHQRHVRGQLPLELVSDVPEQISAWFGGKVPFLVKLPNYQASSGQEKLYQLQGARLVGYQNDYAAYVAYEMRSRPISLVVTSDAVAQPTGGEQIIAKGITFHYNSINGLKVLTWSDRGLTYALVSDLEERGQQSCVVCHQGVKDRDFIESLRPK
ncbi:MAG: hypothetical protein H0U60_14445 [Blastocatellia bacterium]|nr:hypothetical protein [Blastocatellia bacterium]